MGKTLVVLCDGTWQTADQEYPTNVALMYSALNKRDENGALQVAFYQAGVGTDNLVDKVLGGAFGYGLTENVREAYRFIVTHYDPGDRLFLFGFSRGAYTARSLSGLIGCVGILDRSKVKDRSGLLGLFLDDLDDDIEAAYDYYRTPPKDRHALTDTAFLTRTHKDTEIEFVGVWDTVGALGIPTADPDSAINRRLQFHDVDLSHRIRHAYHAVALDELREPFLPTLWGRAPDAPDNQVVEQVWFAGDHGGVGGGRLVDGLSNVAFQWMAEKAMACGLSLNKSAAVPEGIKHPDRQPYIKDPVINTVTGIYRRFDNKGRTVKAQDVHPGQSLHPTVRDKINLKTGYTPAATGYETLP